MEEKAFWVGFNHVKGIGAVRLKSLLDFFGNLSTAWNAPNSALKNAGLSQKIVERFDQFRNNIDLDALYEEVQQSGVQVITWEDEGYPRRLREIDQSPPILYLRGYITLEDEWAVAIIGTRRVTGYGRQVTSEIASFLARNGITVVSGLARGIDGLAHQAALNAGGRTIAVLGCGVDRIYPPEHRSLTESIIEKGAIISDYPPGTPPEGVNFPPRNRIISGLSLATVVVEAGDSSGALITSTFAVEQGRDVFAVPGNIYAVQSRGTNRLIQQGARPLLKASEILDVLNLQQIQEHRAMRSILPANEAEEKLLRVIGKEPLHVDEIRIQSGLPIAEVSSTLTLMELKGMVNQVGGMNYVVTREEYAEYKVNE